MPNNQNRFYPNNIKPFSNEPLKSDFQIISTSDKGEGIISLRSFNIGDIVFSFAGEILENRTLFTLQIDNIYHIHDPYFMGKVLHSCDPNLICQMGIFTFKARKKINIGDFLTMDYEDTEDELWRAFDCCCGSRECKGSIRGKKYSEVLLS